jgi:hypothetical protein
MLLSLLGASVPLGVSWKGAHSSRLGCDVAYWHCDLFTFKIIVITGGLPMLRISVFIAAVTLVGTTANVSAAQLQKPANTKACTQEEFTANCQKKGIVRCDYWWGRQQSMGGNCLR